MAIDLIISNTIENRLDGGFAVVFSNEWEPEEFKNWDDLLEYLEDCYLPYNECKKRKEARNEL